MKNAPMMTEKKGTSKHRASNMKSSFKKSWHEERSFKKRVVIWILGPKIFRSGHDLDARSKDILNTSMILDLYAYCKRKCLAKVASSKQWHVKVQTGRNHGVFSSLKLPTVEPMGFSVEDTYAYADVLWQAELLESMYAYLTS
jgi:hypothetical protein